MDKINRNKKFMSTLLVGASAASLLASTTTANASSALLNFFTEKVGKGIKQVLAQSIKNFVKDLKKSFTFYKWFTFDMVPEAFNPPHTPGMHPLQPFVGMGAILLWLAVQDLVVSIASGAVCLIYKSIKNKKFENKINQLKEKHGDDYIFKINDLLSEEDGKFIEDIKGKYGENYAKKLEKEYRKKVLESMLENKVLESIMLENEDRPKELKNCKKYFESIFVVNNPESEEFFEQNKDNPEKDYGLIGPNKLSYGYSKFIKEELPKMKKEIDFLKKKRNFKNGKELIRDFRQSLVKYYHLHNIMEDKTKDEKLKCFGARNFFLRVYMSNISPECAAGKKDHLLQMGNDKTVDDYWNSGDKCHGLLNTESLNVNVPTVNFVSKEDKFLYNELMSKQNGAEELKETRDAFKEYIFYLHRCNKQMIKADKGFKDFLNKKA